MKDTLGDQIHSQLGGDLMQIGGDTKAPDQFRQPYSELLSNSPTRKLELRKKINQLIELEAEDKYISSTSMPQPTFETNNYRYLAAERGRHFGRQPSDEFKKDVMMRMLARRSTQAGSFSRTRLTSQISHLIDVVLR